MKNPFWVGKRLYFRAVQKPDMSGPYFQWFNDQEVTRFMYNGMFPNSTKKMKDFFVEIEAGKHIVFAVCTKVGDRHIGNIGIHRINWRDGLGEYGIILGDKRYHGRGYGEEATRMILDYAFGRVGLRRVWLGVHANHANAITIYKKTGFKIEGRMRQEMLTDGVWCDKLLMGLLKEEYLGK